MLTRCEAAQDVQSSLKSTSTMWKDHPRLRRLRAAAAAHLERPVRGADERQPLVADLLLRL